MVTCEIECTSACNNGRRMNARLHHRKRKTGKESTAGTEKEAVVEAKKEEKMEMGLKEAAA